MSQLAVWEPIEIIAKKVNSGEYTAISQVEKSLLLIEQNEEYKAIIAPIKERALERAESIDSIVASGKNAGKLAGVVFIAKDNFLVFGADITAASNMLKGFQAPYQSTAIERLEAEGAICVAKANLDAFAHGSSTENSDFFATKNPHDKTRVPGGSSGGSAAAVALQLAPFTLGTDTGGSVRQPASFCGIVGLKPSYGLVSRNGVISMASSTDTVGIMASTATDVSMVLDYVAGKDTADSTTIQRQDDYTNLEPSLKGKKIAIIEEYMVDGVSDEVRSAVESAIAVYEKAGATVSRVSLPTLEYALAAYYIVTSAEISSNLARYDGQRFGYHAKDAEDLTESYETSRQQGFGTEAKRRIMIGTYVLSSGYYDAYYKKAQTVRTKLVNEVKQAFKEFDFLVSPTTSTVAFKSGEYTKNPLQMYLTDTMTTGFSMIGVPAISIPCREVSGLPVGLQLIADQGKDKELLAAAKFYQEADL